jgi:hypothetical protein
MRRHNPYPPFDGDSPWVTAHKNKISNLSNIKFVRITIDQYRKWQLTTISGTFPAGLV